MKKFFPIIFFIVGIVPGACAQNMQAGVDKKQILIGERIHYTVQFSFPKKDYAVEWNIPDTLSHFEILGGKDTDTLIDNKFIARKQLVITSWDSGKWSIPSFAVKLRNVSNPANVYSVNTPVIPIDVGYMPIDSSGTPRDIKPIIETKLINKQNWYWIVAGVLLVLLISYIIYRWLEKRRKRPKPLFQEKYTPYDEAMRSFKELEKLNLQESDQIVQYHSGISDTFKKYLSRKLNRPLMQYTTDDVLLHLKSESYGPDVLSNASAGLRGSDAVKFAKYRPFENDSRNNLTAVKNTIEIIEKKTIKPEA